MAKRLTMLFILFSLAAGVIVGTPLHERNDGMMECCKRARSKEQSPMAEATRLCCAVNCSTSTPTPSGASFNAAPANFTVTGSIADQIAGLFAKVRIRPATSFVYSREAVSLTSQPSYIRHHAFLV